MNKEKFGEFICKLRKEKGITQQELENTLHLKNNEISKWEQGLSLPDICILQDIAQILDVSVVELLDGERNREIDKSNEAVNTTIEDTAKDSGRLIPKIRRKLTVVIGLIIGSLPLVLMLFSCGCFCLIKDEKSLDNALHTLIFISLAALIVSEMFGVPILGMVFTKMWHDSNFMKNNKKSKKTIYVALYFVFGIWLIFSAIRVIDNIVK